MQLSIKKITLLPVFLSVFILSCSQSKTAMEYAEQMDSVNLKTTMSMLTSDEFKGRDYRNRGDSIAADYLAAYLKTHNIKAGNGDSYFQNIEPFESKENNKKFLINDQDYSSLYSYNNDFYQDSLIRVSELLFAGCGNGETMNNLKDTDISEKILMMIFDIDFENPYRFYDPENAYNNKPKALLIVVEDEDTRHFQDSYYYRGVLYNNHIVRMNKKRIPEIYIRRSLADILLKPAHKTVQQLKTKMEKTRKPTTFNLNTNITIAGNLMYRPTEENNVVAIIEGTDLKDEYIVLSAHYDHVGVNENGEIFNGADDNASGVSSVLEIARMLNKAKNEGIKFRRSIVILLPNAEEKGLCGSNYYTEHPIFPLEKTIACVNIDMIGRIIDKHADENGGNYLNLLLDETLGRPLLDRLDTINQQTTKLRLNPDLFSETNRNAFNRSDQYNFHIRNVPSIFFSSGFEHPDYHQTTDDIEKITFTAMLERDKLAFLFLWDLAN
jgi:hypothetical protein